MGKHVLQSLSGGAVAWNEVRSVRELSCAIIHGRGESFWEQGTWRNASFILQCTFLAVMSRGSHHFRTRAHATEIPVKRE